MKYLIRGFLFLAVAGLSLSLRAQDQPIGVVGYTPETFNISLGGFLVTNISIKASLDSSLGTGGTDIDFKKDLGQKSSADVFRVDAEWYITPHHKLEASWFNIRESSSHVLSATIVWGDRVFPVSATINSHFNTQVYKINYGWVFSRTDTNEWAALIGVHLDSYDAGLAIAGGGPGVSQNSSVTAPLPLVGLEWKHRYSEKWSSKVSLQYFGISLEDNKYSGHLTDFLATADYRLTDHWSLSAGYNRFDLSAKMKTDNLTLKLSHTYNGLILAATARF